MDFVYIADVARANVLAAERRRHRRGLQRRQRRGDEPARACRDAAEGDGLRPRVEFGPERAVNKVAAPAGRHRAARASCSASTAEVDLEEGLPRLVDWWRAERAGGRRPPGEGVVMEIPFAKPYLRGRRGRRGRRGDRLRLGLPGPAGARVRGARSPRASAPPTRWRRPTARPRCSSRCYVLGRRAGRRGDRAVAVVHRHRQRGLAVRRRRRCSPTSTRAPTTSTRPPPSAAITPRTKAIMPVHQVGLPADMDAFLELGRAPRRGDRRGRRLRDRRDLQGPARSARSARWPASRCTRAR